MTYKRSIQRVTISRNIEMININLHIKQTTEMTVESDVALLLESLRGTHGLKAKKKAFKFLIDTGSYAYDQLCEMFPVYTPKPKSK